MEMEPTLQRRLELLNTKTNKQTIKIQGLERDIAKAQSLLKACFSHIDNECISIEINKFLKRDARWELDNET